MPPLHPLRRAAALALSLALVLPSPGGTAEGSAAVPPPVPVPAPAPTDTSKQPVPVSAEPAPTATPAAGVGVRGLWVDAFGPGLKTSAQVRRMVDDAAKMGINTLFVQAIRRSDCLCRRSSLPMVTDADLQPGFDPLEAVIKLAKPRGIRVIAWASVTGVANAAVPNSNPAHISRTHGPNMGAQSWYSRRPDGTYLEGSDAWLDVGIPAAADYITAGVVSLVKNYAVDGVQLDRIRYPDGGVWGYDPKVIARFNAETGASGLPAAADPAWLDWKRDQVTALVRRIALEVKGVRSNLWVTAATITYLQPPRAGDLVSFRRTRTYNDVLQDWPTWMHDGLIDLNVLMNYKRDGVADQAAWFDGWNTFAATMRPRADGGQAELAVGTALYLNSPAVIASQAARAVNSGLGWVGYSYRTPNVEVYGGKATTAQGLDVIRALLTAPGAALNVPARWTANPPTTRGLLGRVTGAPVLGNRVVEALQGGEVVARSLTDGSGYYGFAALPAGSTEIRVSGQRWTDTIPARGVVRLPDLLVRDLQPVPALPPAKAAPVVAPAQP
ncbi:glycoside hydrolase family 10 protein [Deinococcus aquatilis]|uniref:glycoside hydrolase family 10 protein n=1 Tax=Deinococcus aquatilis TaxID=519440 RepID=UPI00037654CF|nr:family 10 glycosylhydrolase [Deinococcus aquatilis]